MVAPAGSGRTSSARLAVLQEMLSNATHTNQAMERTFALMTKSRFEGEWDSTGAHRYKHSARGRRINQLESVVVFWIPRPAATAARRDRCAPGRRGAGRRAGPG